MPEEHTECIQVKRLESIEEDVKKCVPWGLGITLVSAAFGLCCLGFMLLHGMVTADKIYAAEQLSSRTNRIEDGFEAFRMDNERQHREMLSILLRLK